MSPGNLVSASHFCITFGTILLLSLPCSAYRADFRPPTNQLNRRFAWSTKAPLTRAINELVPEAIPYNDLIIRHVARLERAAQESLKRTRVFADSPVQPCNPRIGTGYLRNVNLSFGMMGLPQPAAKCGTELSGVQMTVNDAPGYTMDDIYEALVQSRAAMQLRVKEIGSRVVTNFSRPAITFNYRYDTTAARCMLTAMCTVRAGDHWYAMFSINNNEIDDFVKDGERQSALEFARVVDGKLGDNILMRLPVYDEGDVKRVFLDTVTTLLQRWSQTPNPSCFIPISREDNPAMLESLDRVDFSVQQVQDAVTPSNLAILLFPLVLTLVPVALFADVDTLSMLAYMLLSDVLAVVPLAIKGVELEIFRRQPFRSVISRVSTNDIGDLTVGAGAGAEVWGAECRIREEDGRVGIVLIIVALVFLCVGISAELTAAWYAKKRKKRRRNIRGPKSLEQNILLPKPSEGWFAGKPGSPPPESAQTEMMVMDCDVGACGVEPRYSDEREDDAKHRKIR